MDNRSAPFLNEFHLVNFLNLDFIGDRLVGTVVYLVLGFG